MQGAASATRGTVHTPLAPANAAMDVYSTIRALSEHNRLLTETVKVLTDRMQSDRTVNPTPRQHLTFTPQAAYPNPPTHPARHSIIPALRPQLPVYAPLNVPPMLLSQPPSFQDHCHQLRSISQQSQVDVTTSLRPWNACTCMQSCIRRIQVWPS